MAVIGDLVARLTADTRGFDRGMQSSRGTLGGLVKSIGRMPVAAAAAIAGTVAAFRGMSQQLKAASAAARVQEMSERKLGAVLKATGGAAGLSAREIAAYAAELQGATNFGDEATIDAAAMLATFKEIKGDTFLDALASVQDMSAVMGTDLKSSVLQVGKALNDPIRGIGALSRVGIQFTKQQREQITALAESGDLLGAQSIIMGELKSEYGGAAAAMADPLTQIDNQLGDIQENIGFALLPALREIATGFMDMLSPVSGGTDSIKEFGESLGAAVRDGIRPLIAAGKEASEWVMGFASKAGFAFRNFADLAQLAMIDAELAIFDLVPGAEEAFGQVAGFLLGVWDGAGAAFDAFLTNVIGGFQEIVNVATAIAIAVKAAMAAAFAGENPASAFTDAFLQEFATQTDAKSGGNPIEAFRQQFDETRQAVREGFSDSGGLGADLRREREALLRSISDRESAFAAREHEEAIGSGVIRAGEEATAADRPKLGGALVRGSADAIAAINNAMSGRDEPVEKVAELSRQQLAEQKRIVNEISRLNRAGRPLVFSL